MCEKIQHVTRDAALEHIKLLVWKDYRTGHSERSAGLNAYPCEDCGTWHVGHAAQLPPVWHYTVMRHLGRILDSDELRPHAPRLMTRKMWQRPIDTRIKYLQAQEPEPLLWFSRNTDWEYSLMQVRPPWSRMRHELAGRGLLRFGVPQSFAKLRWSDYLDRNPTTRWIRDELTARGTPVEWLATDEAIPLPKVRSIEVYFRGAWVSVHDMPEDAEFDRYLADRVGEYKAAAVTLDAKVHAAVVESGGRCDADVDAYLKRVGLTETERILHTDVQHLSGESGSTWQERVGFTMVST